MKVKTVKGYLVDGEPHSGDDVQPAELYQCGECEELYEDRDDAKECCK